MTKTQAIAAILRGSKVEIGNGLKIQRWYESSTSTFMCSLDGSYGRPFNVNDLKDDVNYLYVVPEGTDAVYDWLESYTEEEIKNYPNKEDALYTIDEIGFESNATMSHDDPALIELFDQLDVFKKLLITEIEKEIK